MKKNLPGLLAGLLACVAMSAQATEAKLEQVELAGGLPAQERGAETVATVCVGCHSLKYIKYRDLLNLGINKDKVDAWRSGQSLDATLQAQMPEEAARAAFGGAAPPDLSLMAAAREGGGRYLYSYLIGYHMNEKGELTNRVFPETRMPDVLGAAGATDVQQRDEVASKANDISTFLVWAADPRAEERKRIGIYVLAYMALMTALLYLWKKQVWRDIDMRPKIK